MACHEPLAEAEGLVPTFTGISDYPEVLPDETLGTMTDAHYQLAQHFYTARPLVAETHMLLKVQTVAPH
jgi:hypothetical protein